jgi:hypothetical protein
MAQIAKRTVEILLGFLFESTSVIFFSEDQQPFSEIATIGMLLLCLGLRFIVD